MKQFGPVAIRVNRIILLKALGHEPFAENCRGREEELAEDLDIISCPICEKS